MAWYVDLPDPHENVWVNIDSFDTKEDALAYAAQAFGADEEGRISLVTPVDDDFVVDVPDPRNPDGAWVFQGTFRTMEEAGKFVDDEIGHHEGDGRIRVVFQVEDEEEEEPGPREWSPRKRKA